VFDLDFEKHYRTLASYEEDTYTLVNCEVQLDDGKVLNNCWAFCWAGDLESDELTMRSGTEPGGHNQMSDRRVLSWPLREISSFTLFIFVCERL
jgi:hypothetical protein